MTNDTAALRLAIDLVQAPSRVRLAKSCRLPSGVFLLLRVAARDEAAQIEAVAAIDRSPDMIHRAATFFIEQILLDPEADNYRILGADRRAPATELRRNMALLLRGLHPDLEQNRNRTILTSRVTGAWNNLKTPERRAAYDQTLATKVCTKPSRSQLREITRLESRNRRYGPVPNFARGSRQPPQTPIGGMIDLLMRVVSLLFGQSKKPHRSRP